MSEHEHGGHRSRVRTRFRKEGLDAFADHEVLEILLFYAIPVKDVNPVAHRLLKRYGSLSGVMETPPEDLARVEGLGEYAATLLHLIPEVSRRYFTDRWGDKPAIGSSARAGEYVTGLFSGFSYEVFQLISLDSQNRVLHAEVLHEGTINETAVYPRIVVEAALRHRAHSVILAHNHPGGSLVPSQADRELTRRLCDALATVGIRVLDHMVVAGALFTSFAERGWL